MDPSGPQYVQKASAVPRWSFGGHAALNGAVAGGLAAGTRTVQLRTGKYADRQREGPTGRAHHAIG